jgi:hypothetical protein
MNKKRHLNAPGKLKTLYDYEEDILTFKVRDRNYKQSIEFQNFVVDIDEEDFVTGVRVFDASKVFGVEKYLLKNVVEAKFNATIENGVITIVLKFVGKLRNKIIPIFGEKQQFTQQITTPAGQYHLEDSTVECVA